MIVWWLGGLLAERFAGRLTVRYEWVAWLVLAPLALRLGPWILRWSDLVMGVAFCGLIAFCLALQERGWPLAGLGRLQPLGEMSYTLYVVHFPILTFVSGWLLKHGGGVLPEHFGWVGLSIAFCLAFAWALHFVTERPFVRASTSRVVALTPAGAAEQP